MTSSYESVSITGFLGEYYGQGGEFSVKSNLIKVVAQKGHDSKQHHPHPV